MAQPMLITSASNKKIKQVASLVSKAKERAACGCFVAEGGHLFEEAPADRIREIYIAQAARGRFEEKALTTGAPVYVVDDKLFEKMSDTKTPQGVLCLIESKEADKEDLLSKEAPLFLLLDQIRDPGNLGTILRAGEAAGVDGVFLTDGCADPYQPKVVRSAMGALYRMPLVTVEDMKAFAKDLKEKGIGLYGSSLQASGPYDAFDYRKGTAFMIGNESRGIRTEVLELCDEKIIIPMKGEIESLNAGIAASLLVFEAARQRRS